MYIILLPVSVAAVIAVSCVGQKIFPSRKSRESQTAITGKMFSRQ